MSSKTVHRANLQPISPYPVRFTADILFSSLLSFTFFVVFSLFLKLKIYILRHIRLCGRVSERKVFTRPISGNKATFFGLNKEVCTIFCQKNGFPKLHESDISVEPR